MSRVGIDTGGTFTDTILVDGADVYTEKTRTTDDLISGILKGFRAVCDQADIDPGEIDGFSHGSTVAINALIEKEGAKTALVTTEGFRDVLEIGRGFREHDLLYSPCGSYQPPLIKRRHRYEVAERYEKGEGAVTPLDMDDVDRVIDEILAEGYESVAVCFLHAYEFADHEEAFADRLRERAGDVDISLSSDVSPEIREYARTATTTVDAYLKGRVSSYISDLEDEMAAAGLTTPINIMKSDGGAARSQLAKSRPVSQTVSGPVAGVKTASVLGDRIDRDNLITFDMGGTSIDSAMIQGGEPIESPTRKVEGMPINGPFVDIVNVGAGGGSIAWLDDVDALRVGPQSAGANPGPVCYGHGGTEPTVTDADLVLGLLNPESFASGGVDLQTEAARDALREEIAEPLGMDVEEAALAIRDLIDNKMAGAVRTISIDKGFDPRSFALMGFGGAGPMHACNVASELDIDTVIFPNNPGITSSLGCLLSDLKHDYVRSIIEVRDDLDSDTVNGILTELLDRGRSDLDAEGVPEDKREFAVSFDMRYSGQAHNLNIRMNGLEFSTAAADQLVADFTENHEEQYDFVDEENPVEFVNARVTARGRVEKPSLRIADPADTPPESAKQGEREVTVARDERVMAPYYEWSAVQPGHRFEGPGIFELSNSTMWLPAEFDAEIDEYKNLIATRSD
jgi:N-methylhydantoinase A